VEEEYYKAEEKVPNAPSGNNHKIINNSSSSELYPPSPDQPLNILSQTHNIPDPVKDDVNNLIRSSKTVIDEMDIDRDENVIVIPENKDINL
jgi:hypothetical protein